MKEPDLREACANTLEVLRIEELMAPLYAWRKGKDLIDVRNAGGILLLHAHLALTMPDASDEERRTEAMRVGHGIERVLER